LHTDLILGLPGEDWISIGDSFDTLLSLKPHEIQVGILKKLPGAPIAQHDLPWQMTYSPYAPYEILCHKKLTFEELQKLKRFARYWDIYGNSVHFKNTFSLLWSNQDESAFAQIMQFCEWLYQEARRTSEISLKNQWHYLERYLLNVKKIPLVHWNEQKKLDQ
ncbi:MAG: DUF4080 domain-containing protein, partial [Pseudomonadota bacterium]